MSIQFNNSTDVITASGGSGALVGFPINGFKNRIINGAMMIDQRNAGAAVTAESYLVDRWRVWRDQTYSIQQVTDAPSGFANSLKVTKTNTTQSIYGYLVQYIEGFNTADLSFGTASAQTVTLSFWVKSSVTGSFSAGLVNSAENRNYPATYTINSANTWEQKTITIAGDQSGTWIGSTNGKGIGVWFNFGATGSATANTWGTAGVVVASTGSANLGTTNNATFQITGVQLEKGSTATSFDYRPYGTELALCQRYLPAFNSTGTASAIGPASASSATNALVSVAFTVPARVAPTGVTVSSPSHCNVSIGAAGPAASAVALNQGGLQSSLLNFTVSGLTTGQGGVAYFNNASGQILFTGCEL